MERWTQVGLTQDEYRLIVDTLGREPNDLELGLYGGMWSEHCSYKSSKVLLKKFPTTGLRVRQGPGENAGVVDIGDGLAVVFKAESHNHPSAVEPFQGAATGVGGIIRDIFTMGARPIAMFDSLRFGEMDDARSRYLLGGVVGGIAFYGNCIGIPTVGGEIYFEDCYKDNPLVNVLCVGLVNPAKIIKGRAEGVGNSVMLVGAKTGRDGIHGASLLASQVFAESAEDKRPAVQVGDPFMEKLLIEACLEALQTGYIVGLQDLGAAGLTSASSEAAARAKNGLDLDIAKVPRRETGMTPYEVMLSESQERMLVIVKKGFEKPVTGIFARWGLDSTVVGRVTDTGMLRVLQDGVVVGEVPARSLADEGPAYQRPEKRPAYLDSAQRLDLSAVPEPEDYGQALDTLLRSLNIASKEWVYRQYDHMVQVNTIVLPGADAAVLRVKGTRKAIALSTDANGRYCYLDPFVGGAIAVAESARNVVCTGARPVAITNCLNFGNPERPEVMWQFRRTIEGMAEACKALDTPVTGGNVSFYNETSGRAIYPTPLVGMLGVMEDQDRRTTPGFKSAGDMIILLGTTREELGGSEYLKLVHGLVAGTPPALDLQLETAVQAACLDAIEQGIARSAHDCSEGGIAVALAECCFSAEDGAKGAEVSLEGAAAVEHSAGAACAGPDDAGADRAGPDGIRKDALLFGESQSRIIVSCSPVDAGRILSIAQEHRAPAAVIGTVGGQKLRISAGGGKMPLIDRDTSELEKPWREVLAWTLK
ncbi:MAG: phosphoribosylformylglycinamidine synthase subunit PurL [Bacillota bacterium]|nr:phosphoribosylformylglycinamidine synthase subunit PurL [Bacillota bacterium]